MRIEVLAEKPSWHVDDLARAAAERGHTLSRCSWLALCASVGSSQPVVRSDAAILTQTDAIIVRTMPVGRLEQVVFRMDTLHRLERAGVCVLNPPRAMEIAIDKYLALSLLHEAALPVPETIVCQRCVDALAAFEQLGSDIVLKPIFGSEGFGLTRITDRDLAARAFTQLERMGSVIYVQRFIPTSEGDDPGGTDLRLFVIGDRVVAAMRRHSSDWRANVARGAKAEAFDADESLQTLAVKAAAACHTPVAGVDILVDAAGKPWLLEVNASPGWKAIAKATGVDIAEHIVSHIESRVQAAKETARVVT